MLIKRSDPMNELFEPIGHRLIPYINKFLREGRTVGNFTVEDKGQYKMRRDASLKKMRFHPSGDCLRCERRLYFDRDPVNRIDEVFGPKTLMVFMEGTLIHSYLQSMFEEWGKLDGYPDFIGNEVRVQDNAFNIGGYIDSEITFPEDHTPTLVEIKTISSYGFENLKRGPKLEHRMQLGVYLALTGLPSGIIIYVNKDTSEMAEFEIEPMDMEQVFAKWMRVTDAINEGSPQYLAFACREGDQTWKWCPYKDLCRRI